MSSVWHPIHTQSWAQRTGRYERKIRIEWRELIAWHSNNGCLLSILATIPCQVVNLVCNIPKSRLMLYFKEGHFANRYSHSHTSPYSERYGQYSVSMEKTYDPCTQSFLLYFWTINEGASPSKLAISLKLVKMKYPEFAMQQSPKSFQSFAI